MPPRVFVTGTGIISAIGCNVQETSFSLETMRTGIGPLTRVDSVYKERIPVAEVKLSNDELYDLAHPEKASIWSRTALLGLIAAREAFGQSFQVEDESLRTGIISGTTVGGMDNTEVFYKEFRQNSRRGRLAQVVGHDCGDSTERIAKCLGIKNFISTINTACSSSANAIMMGARLIRQNRLDRVVAGGTDALTLFTINGFNSLMILDHELCKPFDENRNGLNLGEGAGFLVLESEASVVRNKSRILCEVSGWGNACDAFHQTASSPEGFGARLSMQKALDSACISAEDIDYVNVHGTGTKNNDLSEGTALEDVFNGKLPPCSSTKSYTGHTLGAAGGIEAVFSVLAIQNGWIYPNLHFSQQMQELHFSPVHSFKSGVNLRHIMSNSFGFGGNNSSLIFSRV